MGRGNIKTITETIKEKLDLVALYSFGVFYKGIIAKNKNERDALERLIRRNPHHFHTIFSINKNHSPKIYRINFDYFLNRDALVAAKYTAINDDKTILRLFIWSIFVEKMKINKVVPAKIFEWKETNWFLDNFESGFPKGDYIVITIPARKEFWKKNNINTLIPGTLKSKRLKDIVEELYYLATVNILDPFTWKKDDPRLLDGGSWFNDKDLHLDLRKYPELKAKVSGKQKKEIDIYYLKKLNETNPSKHFEILQEYRIGQWPI